jgi:hypothetical protein
VTRSGMKGTASVIIQVNGLPLSGSFITSPSSGVELSSVFQWIASNWMDSDLPLSYVFGFVSPSSSTQLTVRGRSLVSHNCSITLSDSVVSTIFFLPILCR